MFGASTHATLQPAPPLSATYRQRRPLPPQHQMFSEHMAKVGGVPSTPYSAPSRPAPTITHELGGYHRPSTGSNQLTGLYGVRSAPPNRPFVGSSLHPPPPPPLPIRSLAPIARQAQPHQSSSSFPAIQPAPTRLYRDHTLVERVWPFHFNAGTLQGKTLFSDFGVGCRPMANEQGVPGMRSCKSDPSSFEIHVIALIRGPVNHPSALAIDFGRSSFFFKIYLEGLRDVCDALFPLEGECFHLCRHHDSRSCDSHMPLAGEIVFDDVVTRGVKLARVPGDPKSLLPEKQVEHLTLTLTSRRPPKYFVQLAQPVELLDEHGRSYYPEAKFMRVRQCTEMDFSKAERESRKMVIQNEEGIVEKRIPTWVRQEEGNADTISTFGASGLLFNVSRDIVIIT